MVSGRMMMIRACPSLIIATTSRDLGKPTDNAYVESFNGTLRAECLDVHWFATLTEAKQIIKV